MASEICWRASASASGPTATPTIGIDRSALAPHLEPGQKIAVDSFFTAERPSLHVVFDRTPRSAVSASGQVTEALPGAAFLTCHVILSHTRDGWRMVEVLATSRFI